MRITKSGRLDHRFKGAAEAEAARGVRGHRRLAPVDWDGGRRRRREVDSEPRSGGGGGVDGGIAGYHSCADDPGDLGGHHDPGVRLGHLAQCAGARARRGVGGVLHTVAAAGPAANTAAKRTAGLGEPRCGGPGGPRGAGGAGGRF